MRIAVMQPTYLSWLGYLDLIDRVDRFVLLDDVAFAGSWQKRVRIKGAGGLQWLTVPISGSHGERIDRIRVSRPGFFEKHLRSIEQSHARSRHRDAVLPGLRRVYEAGAPWTSLAELDIALLGFLVERLDITTPLLRSSELDVPGKRGEKLGALCEKLGATEYLSPPGSTAYLMEDAACFAERGIAVRIARYEHPAYTQLHGPFEPGLSSLDLLLNEGPRSRSILTSGRRDSVTLESLAEPDSMGDRTS